MAESVEEKETGVIVEGMTAKSLRFADDIDPVTTDEMEANENANSLNEQCWKYGWRST